MCWTGLLAILGAIALLAWVRVENPTNRAVLLISEALLVLIAGGLFLHLLPGFNNPRQIEEMQVGPNSVPFSFYYNFDKALIPFVLLAALPTLFRTQKFPAPHKILWLLLLAAIPLLLYVAVLLGGLAIEPHWPDWLGSFMLANLFFVSLAEEAFFRGYVQQRLRQKIGGVAALLITSVLFGLAHFPGGMMLVVFATLAGLIYGLAWHWSGRVGRHRRPLPVQHDAPAVLHLSGIAALNLEHREIPCQLGRRKHRLALRQQSLPIAR